MRTIYNIAKTELKTLFYSPVAWLILVIFAAQVAMPFMNLIDRFITNESLGYGNSNLTFYIYASNWGTFAKVLEYLYLYIPLLTMGLMSREIASGSIKLLFSSPISSRQIIFGKFLSMMIYAVVLMVPLFIMVGYSAFVVKDLDIPYALSGLLGIYLLICAYSAIGLFMSSLTSYQVVAAMGTLAILAVLNFVGDIGQSIDFVRDITYWLSIADRAQTLIKGLISSEEIFYFITVIAMFLSFTIVKFQSGKIKKRFVIAGRYTLVIVVGLLIGYITSRPAMKGYIDLTRTKHNTLTPNSQDIISKLDGGMTITTYVNVLDNNRFEGMPKWMNRDKDRFAQYTRFKPEIKMKYVYYWDKSYDPNFMQYYPNMTDKEIAERICKAEGYDFDNMLTPDEIRKKVDLSGEKNRFVRVIERENGQKVWLRIYNDMYKHPFESEISAALKRMITQAPKVAFLMGHGERDVYKFGDRDYGQSSCSKTFRNSLINQGFDFCTVNLVDKDIPSDINILVIADMKKALSAEEEARLEKYIARGGNIFILAEPRRRKEMASLVARFGVKFNEGIMVKDNELNIPTLVPTIVSKEGVEKTSYLFAKMRRKKLGVAMPTSLSLEYSAAASSGFEATPLLVSEDKSCWNEIETKDFVDEDISLNTKIGEEEKSHTLGLVLTRKLNNSTQRIMMLGDADCISNSNISARHAGIRASNFSFFTAAFEWLSNGKMPIDTRRPRKIDNKVKIEKTGYIVSKVVFIWIIPIALVLLYLFIWFRRRRE